MTGNNKVYKKYQCRYFDDDGTPLNPSCREGDRCRFVHPSDSHWPGRKYTVQPKTQPPSKKFPGSYSKKDASSPPRARYGPPLVSQEDLFRRCKEEETDDIHILAGDPDPKRRSQDGSSTLCEDTPRPNHSGKRLLDRVHSGVTAYEAKDALNDDANTSSSTHNAQNDKEHFELTPAKAATNETSKKMVELFQGLAQISSHVLDMTSEYDRQEKKLQTYTEISATLSKVSNSAAAAVAPNLAEILLNHAHIKNSLDQDLNAIGQIWQEIFLAVTKEVGSVINVSLQQAIVTLDARVETAVNAAVSRIPGLPRSTAGKQDNVLNVSKRPRENDEDSVVDKRRRLDTKKRSLTSTEDILQEMKLKLDQQMASIHTLTKENNELKSMLHTKPSAAAPTAGRDFSLQSNEANADRGASSRDETGCERRNDTTVKYSGSSEAYSKRASSRVSSSENRSGKSNGSWSRRSYSPLPANSRERGRRR
ncbi:hypothetical protein BDZ89DRAFT_1125384 [Hymenopellis radicata]|nr:hypothetical protein BDZ89DRAFT_1125384 [Hymenopellis radicata]